MNEQFVRSGLAWRYRKYAPDDLTLADMEAKADKLDLMGPNPIPPWLSPQ